MDPSPARLGPVDAPALFGLLIVALMCADRSVLNDGDTYTHIAAGTWMLDHWSVLRRDPFSATFAGQSWDAHEWLSEMLLGGAYRAAGLTGVVLLSAAAAGVAVVNLARHVGQWCDWTATMLLTAAAVVCVVPSLLARPHVLALPVMELWVAGLLWARAAGRGPSGWMCAGMLGLIVVWANLHGGFAFGVALAAAFALEASLGQAGWRDGAVRRWWMFVAGAVGAAMLTPQGWAGLLFPFRLLRLHSLSLIQEWQPTDLVANQGFEAVLLGLVALLGCGRVKMGWFRLVVLLGLLHLAIAHTRHTVLFGVVGALLLAEPVGRRFGRVVRVGAPRFGWSVCWPGIAVVVAFRVAVPVAMADSRSSPMSALAQVPVAVAQLPVLNSYQYGGYLALEGLHPFIDGRVDLFGDAFVDAYVAMSRKRGALALAVDTYGIGWAIVPVDDPLAGEFGSMPGWRRQYSDAFAAVYVREETGRGSGLSEGGRFGSPPVMEQRVRSAAYRGGSSSEIRSQYAHADRKD